MSTGSFGNTTPRYISLSVILYGRLCKNSVLWSAPSDMNSFRQLIVSPNVLIRSSKTGPDFSGCDMKRTTSSAYREIWWSTLPSRMGPIEGWFLILMARGSIETAKSKGLRGQSWGVPWCNQNGTDLSWFVRMEEDGWAYNTVIHDTNRLPNPNSSKAFTIYAHSTWSRRQVLTQKLKDVLKNGDIGNSPGPFPVHPVHHRLLPPITSLPSTQVLWWLCYRWLLQGLGWWSLQRTHQGLCGLVPAEPEPNSFHHPYSLYIFKICIYKMTVHSCTISCKCVYTSIQFSFLSF